MSVENELLRISLKKNTRQKKEKINCKTEIILFFRYKRTEIIKLCMLIIFEKNVLALGQVFCILKQSVLLKFKLQSFRSFASQLLVFSDMVLVKLDIRMKNR